MTMADDLKHCGGCDADKRLGEFQADASQPSGRKSRCKECSNGDREGRRERARWQALSEDDLKRELEQGGDALLAFGSPLERASAEALLRSGGVAQAAVELGLTPEQLRAHLSELKRRAARRGYSPRHDMIHTVPEGFHIKGTSGYYRKNEAGAWELTGQWVKSKNDEQHMYEALLDAMSHIADRWTGKAEPVAPPPEYLDEDLLVLYAAGDPHLGMHSWAPETGTNFDLQIAERELCAAVDHLVDRAPKARRALVVTVGDTTHADNRRSTTTAGTPVDSDGRWSKVLAVTIRAWRRIIDRALQKHEFVDVIVEYGNHDLHTSIMLALCLAQFYEREPRVHVDTSPAKFHWYRFGKCLIGTTHGDTVKLDDLGEIMAVDRPQDWGETEFRYFWTGHVHHTQVKELRGCVVRTLRTLAPADDWHKGQGYRSGRDMTAAVIHREFGEIGELRASIQQVQARVAAQLAAQGPVA